MNRFKDTLIIGFALFSMFFGAGNVVFPPHLGLSAGGAWIAGFFCYYLADVGLALAALAAVARRGGGQQVLGRIGAVPAGVLMSAVVLCVGPLLAIPRTAALTYETAVLPLTAAVPRPVFSLLFFLLILLVSLREAAVVDIVGKALTPVLLAGLLVLILRGVASPLGPVPAAAAADVVLTGVEAGYQTMDVLAALIFGGILLRNVQARGYADPRSRGRVILGSGAVAGAALGGVYLGLTYLGATAAAHFTPEVDRTVLMVFIVEQLLGKAGLWLFSAVVALACITTAAALVSASAAHFARLLRGRLPYGVLAAAICLFSAGAATFGLEELVAVAAPILNVLYPPALTLILLSLAGDRIRSDWTFRLAALGALAASLLQTAADLGAAPPVLQALPWSAWGFGWVLPALAGAAAGCLVPPRRR